MTIKANPINKNNTSSASVEDIKEKQNHTEIKVLVSSDSKFGTSNPVNNNHYVPVEVSHKPIAHRGETISFLAHEVRNPLSSINLSIEALNASAKEEQQIYLDIIKRSSAQINDLIIRLLTYQKFDDATGANSIIEIIHEVLDEVDDRINLKNITVIKKFCAEDFVIISNQLKMKIALTNIIVNAIDAMPQEKGILKLTGNYVTGKYLMEIEDNGCGISKEHLQLIFDAGFTNKPGGLGFGLQIVKTVLQANGVEVKVESEEGEFTRFILMFNNYQSGEMARISHTDSEKKANEISY